VGDGAPRRPPDLVSRGLIFHMPVYAPVNPVPGHAPPVNRNPYQGNPYNDVAPNGGMTRPYQQGPQGAWQDGAYNTPPGLGYATPFDRAPGTQILADSNPSRYQSPQGSTRPLGTGVERPLLGGQLRSTLGGGGSQSAANSGSILGSSVGNPGFYGAGLSPASGLGGGLWPSLVNLYR
jgi:hypothetical protein